MHSSECHPVVFSKSSLVCLLPPHVAPFLVVAHLASALLLCSTRSSLSCSSYWCFLRHYSLPGPSSDPSSTVESDELLGSILPQRCVARSPTVRFKAMEKGGPFIHLPVNIDPHCGVLAQKTSFNYAHHSPITSPERLAS